MGNWIQEPEKDTAVLFAIIIGVISFINIIGLHVIAHKSKKVEGISIPPMQNRPSE